MNIRKHFLTILKHKKEVFKLCVIAGIPWQGIVHDLSKFSPTEFFESAKYYQGNKSPIEQSKKVNGYSAAWLHHKGRNKHHVQYWIDKTMSGGEAIQMPYKYELEMVCDIIAASKTYNGKDFKRNMPYEYWPGQLKDNSLIHKKTREFVLTLLKKYGEFGNEALKPAYTRFVYRSIEEKYNIMQNS